MKKLALAVAFSAAASTAFAGGIGEPILEDEVIVAAPVESGTGASAWGVLAAVVIAGVLLGSSGSSSGSH
jgi:hypothetical protein